MLTDEQRAVLEPLFQGERSGAGRPQVHPDREVLNGVLWVLRTGAAERFAGQVSFFIPLLSEIQQMGKGGEITKNTGASGPTP